MPNPEYGPPALLIQLQYALFEVWPERRIVRTTFDDQHYNDAWRDELDRENVLEAQSQGYRGDGPSCVWRSLVEHEFLHSLVSEIVFDSPSKVLTTENGLARFPSWERYEEETICLAFQTYWRADDRKAFDFLTPYRPVIGDLLAIWSDRYAVELSRAF